MSGRPTDLLDRCATLVAGLVVTTLGAAALLWPTHVVRAVPDRISATPVVRATTSPWWPWELAGAGAVLVLIGLAWLISHVPIRKAPVLRVAGTTDPGTITVNLDAVASAAAAALAQEPNIQAAKGRAVTDRGTSTVELTVTVANPAGIADAVAAIERTCVHIARATGDPAVAARTVLQLAKAGGTARSARNLE